MKKENPIKIAAIVIGTLLLAYGAYALLSGEEAANNKKESFVIGYKVSPIEISDKVEALGTALANESIDITSNASETIKEIKFTDGQFVKKGDVLVILDQEAELARLSGIQAKLAEDEIELKRIKSLLDKKAATKREYDERNTSLKVTKEEIKQVQAEIDERTLKATFDGIVGIRRLSVGALVQPGTLITTLDDLSVIKLDFTVPAINLSKLQVGLPVFAESEALPEFVYRGQVVSINTRIDPVTRSVLVRALIENNESRIKPGLLMKVTLLENKRNALMIPEESIIQRGSDHFIYLVEENKVREQKISVGTREFGSVEVTKGIKEGDVVVARGMGEVRDGQEVTVKDIWSKIKNSQFEE